MMYSMQASLLGMFLACMHGGSRYHLQPIMYSMHASWGCSWYLPGVTQACMGAAGTTFSP
jgi:hypothetical protein